MAADVEVGGARRTESVQITLLLPWGRFQDRAAAAIGAAAGRAGIRGPADIDTRHVCDLPPLVVALTAVGVLTALSDLV